MYKEEKERIDKLAKDVLSSRVAQVLSGNYDYLLNLNMEEILERFNNGEYDVLDNETLQKFLNEFLNASQLLSAIVQAKALVQYKNHFLADVQQQKDGMVYDQERIYKSVNSYRERRCTYADIEDAFMMAERFLSDNRIYQLLRFFLRYESLIPEIKLRNQLFRTMKSNPEKTQLLSRVLDKCDYKVGIIKIVIDEEGDKTIVVRVGTKHDMEISNLIGMPFVADLEKEGYSYGPYCDWYSPAKKITKEFYEEGTTPNHQKMIQAEKEHRAKLGSLTTQDIDGFIIAEGYAIIISNQELIRCGIDPMRVGWKPLQLKARQKSLKELSKESDTTKYLSLVQLVNIKKDMVLSKVKR